MGQCKHREFQPLNIAVLSISDSRTSDDDTSGDFLVNAITESGHHLIARDLIKDDKYSIRSVLSQWIASNNIQVVITSGGTGFTAKNYVPEAIEPLFDKDIEGFGELFRHISFLELGTSTMQSRALAGMANQTAIFCLPGSTGACKTGWNKILVEQLDAGHRPCNFVPHLKAVSITK